MKLVPRQCTPKGELVPFSKCRQMMNGEKHILVFARVLQYPCDGPTLDRLYELAAEGGAAAIETLNLLAGTLKHPP